MEMEEVFLLLGSNRGERRQILERALALVGERAGEVSQLSSLYETEPWGFEDAVPFLNQAAALRTVREPLELLGILQGIEEELGRRRPVGGAGPYLPRTIDIDILLWGGRVIRGSRLTVPHPRLALRRFALVPLAEIAAEAVDPLTGLTVARLLERCDDHGSVKRL